MKWYIEAMKKYADFNGRARRKEYWMFILFNAIFLITIIIVGGFIDSLTGNSSPIPGILMGLYILVIIIPTITVTVRRLHDIGKSGLWWFIRFVPIIGGIWFFVLTCLESNPFENQYGPNPYEIE